MMFKDETEKQMYYRIAKDIAVEINFQLGEIEELDGFFAVDVTFVSVDTERRALQVETEFVNTDNGKRYAWTEELSHYKGTCDFLPKVLYCWLKYFADDFSEHGVMFDGGAL